MTVQRKKGYLANANLSNEFSGSPEKADQLRNELLYDVELACCNLLQALRIDTENDPQVQETAGRMARMYVQELMKGRYMPRPEVRSFPNTRELDQLYVVGPVTINSLCAHHMIPFTGTLWLGLVPGKEGRLLGLSKFARLAEWVFCRPQIQEEATVMLADEVAAETAPQALGLVVKAKHMCMTIRGVKDAESRMTTSVMRGLLRENAQLRQEFLSLITL